MHKWFKSKLWWKPLIISTILVGIILNGTALGIVLSAKLPPQVNPQTVDIAGLYGGFAPRLSPFQASRFYQALGFNHRGYKRFPVQAQKGQLTKLFDVSQYNGDVISLARAVDRNRLKITDNLFKQADIAADLQFGIQLFRNEPRQFTNSLTTQFTLRKAVAKLTPHAKPTIVYSFKPPRNQNGQSVTFTPTHFITAQANLSSVILQQLGITNQVNHLIYFAKHNAQAATNGTDADYALILNQQTGQLTLWAQSTTKPIVCQIGYLKPLIRNRQLLKEVDTTNPPVHIPAPDRAAWLQLRSQAKFADFYLARNGFKQQIAVNDQSAFFKDLNLPQSHHPRGGVIDGEGKDSKTFSGAGNDLQERYSMLANYYNKSAIWLKYLFQHADYETTAIKAEYGDEYEKFKLTDLKQLFVGRSLKPRLKLSLIMKNNDPNFAKKLLGTASKVEFIASFDVVKDRFSLEPIKKNSLIVAIKRSNFRHGFSLKITDHNLVAPKIDNLGTNATLFISINQVDGWITLKTTPDAGLDANDRLTVKFEYMEPIVKKI